MTTAHSPSLEVFGALRRRMVPSHRHFTRGTLVFGLAVFFAAARWAGAQTNIPDGNQDMLRAYLQLQDQIHTTQLAIDRNRQEAENAAAQNAQALEAMRALQQTLSDQRAGEMEALQSSNHLMLASVIAFAGVGLLAMAVTAFFQWRTVTRLETIARASGGPGLPLHRAMAALEAGNLSVTSADTSAARLLGALDRLERRIFELEHPGTTEHKAILEPATIPGSQVPSGPPDGNGGHERRAPVDNAQVNRMLLEGQTLLDQDHAEAAAAVFDQVLALDGNHAEALVRKGVALERLRQPAEALKCYNRAIAADGSLTIAYLHKGGLFNRMERFSEAMECYEQALRTQEMRRG